jgi:hypothetical protein
VRKNQVLAYEENPEKVERADLVVGISSHNGAQLIVHATEQAAKGLVEFFGGKNSVIINCDDHSEDGTKEAFLKTATGVPRIYLSTPPETIGRGRSLRNLVVKAVQLQAKAVVLVNTDLKSITPLWIKNLGEPIFAGFGFVTPLYLHHKYDGVLTNGIVYPFSRALYGRRVRQPATGDFGFTMELAETFLDHPTWNQSVSQDGIDIWMTTLAINQGVPICQSFVGRPKIQSYNAVPIPSALTFAQVVATVFELMMFFSNTWARVKWSKPTAIFGFGMGEVEAPAPLEVPEADLHRAFVLGFVQYQRLWKSCLGNNIYNKLGEIREMPMAQFSFPSELWARILFRYAISYKNKVVDRRLLIQSLMPIFLGKMLSFIKKTERMSIQQAEEYIENECMIFEEMKPYLLSEWGESH